MAGKTKKKAPGSRPVTPKSPQGMMDSPLKGHLGTKSSPFAVTDSKLVSQYMVLDHMNAHYRKLNNAKSAVDCSAPKAWLVSQKVRDRARREALKTDIQRRSKWLNDDRGHFDESYASSEVDRDEMYAMLQSYQALPAAGPDELDGRMPPSDTTVLAHASSSTTYKPDAKDLQMVNKMVNDQHISPSKYHSSAKIHSNIPTTSQRNKPRHPSSAKPRTPRSHAAASHALSQHAMTQQDAAYTNGYTNLPTSARGHLKPTTPRSADLLVQHDHKFTAPEKPFAPRTLKTNTQSRLSSFKYYNPPKKQVITEEEEEKVERKQNGERSQSAKPVPKERRGSVEGTRSLRGSMVSRQSRPETPYSEVDWMNETLMSRDGSQGPSPAEVPALNISLDADHVKWLKEQTRKAHVRSSARSRSEVDDMGSTWGSHRAGRTQTLNESRGFGETQHLNGDSGRPHPHPQNYQHHHQLSQQQQQHTMNMSGTMESTGRPQFTLSGSIKSSGYYPKSARTVRIEHEEEELKYLEFIQDVTNDVLDRNIFTNRVLKNVFESHIEKKKDTLKVAKMREMLEDLRLDLGIPDSDEEDGMGLKSTLDFTVDDNPVPRHKARKHAPTSSQKMPTLRHPQPQGGRRSASPDAKPPLPRPGSRGSYGRPGSASSLRGSGELRMSQEEFLAGSHSGEDTGGTMTGSSTFGMVTALQTNEQTADVLTIEHVDEAQEDDDIGLDETDKPADDARLDEVDQGTQKAPTDDEEEMPPKTKMVDDMTLSYQYALEDTLDVDVVSETAEDDDDQSVPHMNGTGHQTLDPIMEVDTPKEKSPQTLKPTPKLRRSLTPRSDPLKDTPRSQARTNTTSDSIDVSDLDDTEDF